MNWGDVLTEEREWRDVCRAGVLSWKSVNPRPEPDREKKLRDGSMMGQVAQVLRDANGWMRSDEVQLAIKTDRKSTVSTCLSRLVEKGVANVKQMGSRVGYKLCEGK